MEQTLEKPKKDYTKLTEETVEEYLRKNFPIKEGEKDVKYCKVGTNNFRINFYKEKDGVNFFKSYYINRSFYVILSKKKKSWKHKIL